MTLRIHTMTSSILEMTMHTQPCLLSHRMFIFEIIALKLQQNNIKIIHVHSENIKMEILTKNTLIFVRRYSFFENKNVWNIEKMAI